MAWRYLVGSAGWGYLKGRSCGACMDPNLDGETAVDSTRILFVVFKLLARHNRKGSCRLPSSVSCPPGRSLRLRLRVTRYSSVIILDIHIPPT